MGSDGNEIADKLSRQGSSCPLIRPELALGISVKVARGVMSNWTNRKHEQHWQSRLERKQAKSFLKNPSAKKAEELLSVNGNQLRIMTGLLIGHCHLKRHVRGRCKQAHAVASHVLDNSEAVVKLKFRLLG
jgi:hypothetical protein